jgi:capsid protein
MPWIGPLNEAQANIAAIGACLSTRTRVLRDQGLDFEELAAELAKEQKLLESLGLPTTIAPVNSQVIKVSNA